MGRDKGEALGTRESFSDVAATIAEYFDLDFNPGTSFLGELMS